MEVLFPAYNFYLTFYVLLLDASINSAQVKRAKNQGLREITIYFKNIIPISTQIHFIAIATIVGDSV
jgi:hypothetical protein